MINTHNVISFEFVRHGTVSGSSDHGGHRGTLFHEVLFADGVIKALPHGNVAEFDTVTRSLIGHKLFGIERLEHLQ